MRSYMLPRRFAARYAPDIIHADTTLSPEVRKGIALTAYKPTRWEPRRAQANVVLRTCTQLQHHYNAEVVICAMQIPI